MRGAPAKKITKKIQKVVASPKSPSRIAEANKVIAAYKNVAINNKNYMIDPAAAKLPQLSQVDDDAEVEKPTKKVKLARRPGVINDASRGALANLGMLLTRVRSNQQSESAPLTELANELAENQDTFSEDDGEVKEKFGEQNFRVLSEMRILVKIKVVILDLVG